MLQLPEPDVLSLCLSVISLAIGRNISLVYQLGPLRPTDPWIDYRYCPATLGVRQLQKLWLSATERQHSRYAAMRTIR
jgi:hypothetical protein